MSRLIINSFAVEGSNGKRVYDFVMSAIEECKEFNRTYQLGCFYGYSYSIIKYFDLYQNGDNCIDYVLKVHDENDEMIARGYFRLNDIRYENNVVRISECSYSELGAITAFIKDCGIMNEDGFYFMEGGDEHIAGLTNDVYGKYFNREAIIMYIDGKYKLCEEIESFDYDDNCELEEFSDIVKRYFYNLPIEEQIEYCNSHKDYICYDYTEFVDAKSIWRI